MKSDDSDSSFNWSSEDEEYGWDEFTKETEGFRAPYEAFNQSNQIPVNAFEKGQILMSNDRKLTMDGYGLFVARVEKVYKCFVNINIVEINRQFWTMCDNECLSPFLETSLRRHPDNARTDKAWEKWLAKFMENHHDNIAPQSMFKKLPLRFTPKENLFTVGMVLAYLDDHRFTGKLNPAIVVDVKNSGMITLQLADRSAKTLVSLNYSDRRLFPIEFVKKADIPVRSGKKNNKKGSKSILKCPTKSNKKVVKKESKKLGRPKGSKNSSKNAAGVKRSVSTVASLSFHSDVRSSRSVTPELGFCPKRTSTPKSERNSFITTPPPPIKKPKCEESSVEDTRSMDSIYLSSDINFPSRSSSFYNTSAQAESSVFIYPNNNSPVQEFSSLEYTKIAEAVGSFETPKQDVPAVPSIDSLIESTTLFRLQTTWLLNCNSPGFTPSQITSPFPLMSMLQTVKSEMCIAQPNSSASVGPLLSWITLREALVILPPMHYKMQFYNIISALIKNGKTATGVFEKIGYNDLAGDSKFSIYARCNDQLLTKQFAWPQSFNNARTWLKVYLKQINADENLIDLQTA